MEKFDFKKSLGQNFLKDKNIIKKITDSINPDEKDLVIEIGPGEGALTKELIKSNAQLLCIEIDRRLETRLNKIEANNLEIVFEDFLNFDLTEYLKKYKYNKLYFIGNLPYYITTPIIKKIIENHSQTDEMVFMVQKEVGERFNAKPGNKNYGSLTVFLNYYFDIEKVVLVPKTCFIPQPKIDSIVIKFKKKEQNYNLKSEEHFFKLVKDSFQFKRKTLRNNLKNYDISKLEKYLQTKGKSASVRAEQLDLNEFIEISNYLN